MACFSYANCKCPLLTGKLERLQQRNLDKLLYFDTIPISLE